MRAKSAQPVPRQDATLPPRQPRASGADRVSRDPADRAALIQIEIRISRLVGSEASFDSFEFSCHDSGTTDQTTLRGGALSQITRAG